MTAVAKCPNCGETSEKRIQFAYGDTWQLEYQVGERLGWGGNDKGVPGAARVIVRGFAEDCADCGSGEEFDILVENDVLMGATPRLQPDGGPASVMY
ncbi:MAG: hypothetical protein ACRD1K_07905 [Acidimicrobiales bacterium]